MHEKKQEIMIKVGMLNAKIKSIANDYPNKFILSAVKGMELKIRQ